MRSSSAADDLVWYLWGDLSEFSAAAAAVSAAACSHLATLGSTLWERAAISLQFKVVCMIVQYPSDLQQLPQFITTCQSKISSERLQIIYSVVMQSFSETTCISCDCAWVIPIGYVCSAEDWKHTGLVQSWTNNTSFSSPIDKTCVRKGSACSAAVAQLPGCNLAWPEN